MSDHTLAADPHPQIAGPHPVRCDTGKVLRGERVGQHRPGIPGPDCPGRERHRSGSATVGPATLITVTVTGPIPTDVAAADLLGGPAGGPVGVLAGTGDVGALAGAGDVGVLVGLLVVVGDVGGFACFPGGFAVQGLVGVQRAVVFEQGDDQGAG